MSSLPQAAGSGHQQDPALSCPARGLLTATASSHSTLGSSLGRLSAEPGRQQRPCPGTQPLGHSRDPALHHSPGHPCLHPGYTVCSWSHEKETSSPVTLTALEGNLCSGASHSSLIQRNSESPPERSRRLWDVPETLEVAPGRTSVLPCSQRLTLFRTLKISPQSALSIPPSHCL